MSLFPTEKAALKAKGTVYRHFKGGIYRVIAVQEDGSVDYEHLWPHEHAVSFRPVEEFRDSVDRPEYKGLRYTLVKGRAV